MAQHGFCRPYQHVGSGSGGVCKSRGGGRPRAASHQLTHGDVERSRRATQLALISEPLRLRPGGYRLTYVPVASATGPNGEDVRLAGGLDMRGLFEERFPPETRHRAVLTFGDLENEPVPPGPYRVEIEGLRVLVQGLWELSWDVPSP